MVPILTSFSRSARSAHLAASDSPPYKHNPRHVIAEGIRLARVIAGALQMRSAVPLLNGREAYERHHFNRAARSGYFTAVLHLGHGRRLREEHRTLEAAVAGARRLADQGMTDRRPSTQ